MAQITYAKAAEQLAAKKAALEKRIEKGDKWTQNALTPQLAKLDAKIEELKQMNEQARVEKFNKGFQRFQKKYGGYLPQAELGMDTLLENRATEALNQSGWQQYGNKVMEISPMLWNAYNSMRRLKQVPLYVNPYEKEAAKNIREGMSYDTRPQMEQADIERANMMRLSRDAAMGSGYDLMRYGAMGNRMHTLQKGAINQWKQNTENQAKMQGAGMLFSMGQDAVKMQQYRDDLLAQEEANRRNYARQLSMDMSEYAQRNSIQNNAKVNDYIMWQAYKNLGLNPSLDAPKQEPTLQTGSGINMYAMGKNYLSGRSKPSYTMGQNETLGEDPSLMYNYKPIGITPPTFGSNAKINPKRKPNYSF